MRLLVIDHTLVTTVNNSIGRLSTGNRNHQRYTQALRIANTTSDFSLTGHRFKIDVSDSRLLHLRPCIGCHHLLPTRGNTESLPRRSAHQKASSRPPRSLCFLAQENNTELASLIQHVSCSLHTRFARNPVLDSVTATSLIIRCFPSQLLRTSAFSQFQRLQFNYSLSYHATSFLQHTVFSGVFS